MTIFVRNSGALFSLLGFLLLNLLWLDLWNHFGRVNNLILLSSWNMVHILEVPAQVSTLSESFLAELASEWTLTRVFSKVVSQVTTFLENAVATWIPALEEQLDSLGRLILDFYGLVPLLRNASECL